MGRAAGRASEGAPRRHGQIRDDGPPRGTADAAPDTRGPAAGRVGGGRASDDARGLRDREAARRTLDQGAAARPTVAPSVYGEPLLIPNVKDVFTEIKRRGMPIVVNTNGLTLTDDLSRFFVDLQVDSIMFSLDSVTKETLQKVRGVDRLEKIESNVFRLMRVRGDSEYPRVGVSFTIQPENKHELDAFVSRWVGVVDVVRTCPVFDTEIGTFTQIDA